jgi:hypothetical protein
VRCALHALSSCGCVFVRAVVCAALYTPCHRVCLCGFAVVQLCALRFARPVVVCSCVDSLVKANHSIDSVLYMPNNSI